LYDRTIVLNGVSKVYSMTGWRIGYCGGPKDLINAMTNIQSQSTSNPTSISQVAAEAGLNGDQSCVAMMTQAFKERHDYVYKTLKAMEGVEVAPADGTFYIFPSFQKVIERLGLANDIAFAELLLNEVGVALVPGSAFGAEGCGRISFATSMSNLVKALERIGRVIAR
jgi:aspartate aminotransferase